MIEEISNYFTLALFNVVNNKIVIAINFDFTSSKENFTSELLLNPVQYIVDIV